MWGEWKVDIMSINIVFAKQIDQYGNIAFIHSKKNCKYKNDNYLFFQVGAKKHY